MRMVHVLAIPPVDLEIRHLRLVAEISDAGSMTKAAERLFLTQSALSHQLRDIEARFDTPFFVRVGRKMVLTAAGRRVLETARRVIGDIQRVEDGHAPAGRPHRRRASACARSATPATTGWRRC